MLSRQGSKAQLGDVLARRPSKSSSNGLQRRTTVEGGGGGYGGGGDRSPLAEAGAALAGESRLSSSRSGSKQIFERRGSKQIGPSRSQSTGMLRRGSTINTLPIVEEPPTPAQAPFRMPSKPLGPQRASAALLVAKHRLEFHEVNQIVSIFEDIKPCCTGGLAISKDQLAKGMAKLFDVDRVNPDFVDKVFGESKAGSAFDIDKFLEWYVHNMFTCVAALRGDQDRVASDKLVYDLARSYGVSPVMIDKIKQKFDAIDEDGSGLIDADEFKKMIQKLLNAKNEEDISQDRVSKFFKEIDVDGSGEVDFSEFTEWYLKYFNQDSDPSDPTAGGDGRILEAFYDSFNPTNRRSSTLKNQ